MSLQPAHIELIRMLAEIAVERYLCEHAVALPAPPQHNTSHQAQEADHESRPVRPIFHRKPT